MSILDKKRIVIAIFALAVLGVFAYAFYKNTQVKEPVYTGPHAEVNMRADAIEGYVRENLTTLSPVPASMGGTFYVTRMRLLDGQGTVNYEDGHNAYVADFTYTIGEDNKTVDVTSFTLKEPAE